MSNQSVTDDAPVSQQHIVERMRVSVSAVVVSFDSILLPAPTAALAWLATGQHWPSRGH